MVAEGGAAASAALKWTWGCLCAAYAVMRRASCPDDRCLSFRSLCGARDVVCWSLPAGLWPLALCERGVVERQARPSPARIHILSIGAVPRTDQYRRGSAPLRTEAGIDAGAIMTLLTPN